MASLNLAGKTSGYVKLQAPDDSSNNPVVTLPTESGELALKSDIGEGGGKTVAFRGTISGNQDLISATATKVNLDVTEFDTDNALVDGKFQPSVAGYYSVEGSGYFSFTPDTMERAWVRLMKNGNVPYAYGDNIYNVDTEVTSTSALVYLNGSTDYIELYAYVKASSGTITLKSGDGGGTSLSAVLVSGGSASGGDSIWTEEDGKAVYDGDIKITDGTQSLELLVKDGQLDIGTPEEKALVFNTLNTERMRITHDGNVGVGTTPINPLTVSGTSSLGVDQTDYINVRGGHGTARVEAIGGNPNVALALSTKGTGGFDFWQNGYGGTKAMAIDNTSVNIHNDGIKYEGIGSVNVIAFKWNGNVVARIDNSLDVTLASTTRVAEVEEAFDKKLAIKDKLIEKLSERLDELEKKLKK